ncbi:MAG: DUF3179 domain-containing protein [Bacteroidota bacterium]
MKKAIHTFLLFTIATASTLVAQSLPLSFKIYDAEKRVPIENAHVFILNTTFGTTSTTTGQVQFNIPQQIAEDLVISHISYTTKILNPTDFQDLTAQDTVWLLPDLQSVKTVTVRAERSKKWKKRLKKFTKYFLGTEEAAHNCTLLNPEVLRFSEENGTFRAAATDFLAIRNEYLGYEVKYWLTELLVEADGSSTYSGKANFQPLAQSDKKDFFEKNRKTAYEQSPKFFFRSLIDDQVTERGFELSSVKYQDQQFSTLSLPDRANLLRVSADSSQYFVRFPEFLKIVNTNQKEVFQELSGLQVGGLESSRFSNSQTVNKTKVEFATSYLYKLGPVVQLNQFGNVLNSETVKEYGVWANQRVALQLPFDFGNEYDMERKATVRPKLPKPSKEQLSRPTLSKSQQLKLFTQLIYEQNPTIKTKLVEQITLGWRPAFIPILAEFLRLSSDPILVQQVVRLLEEKTGKTFGDDYLSWVEWFWEQDPIYPSYYANFKATYYQHIDSKFRRYFLRRQTSAKVRLDEIVWGGVKQDGIPPLRYPKLIAAAEADYLSNQHTVFGVFINGVAKAYPKRILAWHEFFVDSFGDAQIAGVYCTLCGTVIAYDQKHRGVLHELGTSGFLYRSNKLMYDKETQSLWSTIEGEPVLGPLVDQNIRLKVYPVVTTTWGNWKKLHPNTQVLSINTGHERDYGEGAAYADYFGTDNLMFPVPQKSNELVNKAEVLIVRAPDYRTDPLAVSVDFLKKKKWFQTTVANTNVVILSDKTGATSAFDATNISFVDYKKGHLIDEAGKQWTLKNHELQSSDGQVLQQLPTHHIFWFAWYANYPTTRLVK